MGCVLITGGQLFNKGAQAMLFTVINEIREQNSDKEIVVLSSLDSRRTAEDKGKYNFTIMPYNMRTKLALSGGIYSIVNKIYKPHSYQKHFKNEYAVLKNHFETANVLIDISGYAFSSKWGFAKSFSYMLNIKICKRFKIPMYILPQSFGPFHYNKPLQAFFIKRLMKKYLTYPKAIYARETEGYEELLKYSNKNLYKAFDIVIQNNSEINLKNIYRENQLVELKNVVIETGAVGIIPNEKILQYGDEEGIYRIYKFLTEQLLTQKKTVYLFRHSAEDMYICERIKANFVNEDKVILLTDEYNCIESKHILQKFDFVIASRYHSIVHSYKAAVPAIVLGWAIKYAELLEAFSQEKYLFDISGEINENAVREALNSMIANHYNESKKIEHTLKKVFTKNIFADLLNEGIEK